MYYFVVSTPKVENIKDITGIEGLRCTFKASALAKCQNTGQVLDLCSTGLTKEEALINLAADFGMVLKEFYKRKYGSLK